MNTLGKLPEVGTSAPEFVLVGTDFSTHRLSDYRGKKVLMNIFPSIDSSTCATSVRKFNEKAAELENTVVLCISRDLPYAQRRFCGAEGIENVIMLSDYRDGNFGDSYQLTFTDSAIEGLLSRSIVVLDENGKILYTEQVPDTGSEPDYQSALEALRDGGQGIH